MNGQRFGMSKLTRLGQTLASSTRPDRSMVALRPQQHGNGVRSPACACFTSCLLASWRDKFLRL